MHSEQGVHLHPADQQLRAGEGAVPDPPPGRGAGAQNQTGLLVYQVGRPCFYFRLF